MTRTITTRWGMAGGGALLALLAAGDTAVRTQAPVVRAAAEGPHQHHRQHAGRADAVRRLARDDAPGAVSEARAGLPQPRVQRRRDRTRPRSKNFGTPDEWLSGLGPAHRRLRGQPVRRHQHQGRRHLRVLRLQRVVRRPGRARGLQEAAGRLDRAHARAEVQRQVGAARRALLADRPRGPRQPRPAGRQGRTTSAWRSTPRRWRDVARGAERHVRRSLRADHSGSTPTPRRRSPSMAST